MNSFEQNELEQNEHEAGAQDPRSRRPRRGIYLLPGFLTVANLLCGYYAVLAVLHGGLEGFDNAARAIGFAVLFDSLDGRVARATGTNTEFGKQFDSLADVVSFGIAPALLAYAWGVRGMQSDLKVATHVLQLGWLVSFAFVICSAWRLARFNVHGMAPGGSRYFVGLPTPAAAGMIAAVVHFWQSPLQDLPWALVWLALVAGLAALMSSTARYYSFKDIPWTRRQRSSAIVLIGLLVVSIVVYSQEVLLLLASSYALSGLTLHVVRAVRHRMVSRPA